MREAATPGLDRTEVIGGGVRTASSWALRLVILAAGLWVLQLVLGWLWVVVLPILLAVVVSTVLRPPVRFLVKHRFPAALAALITMVVALGILVGVFVAIIGSVISQAADLASGAADGLRQIEEWLQGPPLSIQSEQISAAVDQVTSTLQSSAGSIAGGALTGATVAGSALVTLVLALVLSFFFIKDAPKFLPWVRRVSGRRVGRHLTEVLTRVWAAVGGFIRTQAIVSAADAVFIAIGLLVLGVPLVAALAALTFLGGFIPIVGAFVAGSVAVLIALVANGPTTALAVLILIIVVQQVEGNVLQPVLQSQSLDLHPVVVILAVTLGGSAFGIVGAFFAVPVAAALAVVLRYMGEQVDLRSGNARADDLEQTTAEGDAAASIAEQKGTAASAADQPPTPPPAPPRRGLLGWADERLGGRRRRTTS